jgi:urea transport system substrate-binding protein
MTINELLRDIGLSDKEAQMYLTLLRHGTQSTSILARKAGFNRGTGYVILHHLLEKGLAKKSTKGKIQYFSPLDPKNLVSYLEGKKKKLESNKDKVEAMMGQLLAITNPHSAQPKIEFFDGEEGARKVLESTFKAKEKTLFSFVSLVDLIDFVGVDFFEEYSRKRSASGYSMRSIRTHESDKHAIKLDPRAKHHTTNKKEKREVRYAPSDLAFPMTMFMFDSKLAIISSKEENFSVLIESKEFAHMQKKLFELLWASLDTSKIKVGVLHSLTGTMAISEPSLVDAVLMAIDEINEAGGVLGKQIEPIVVDSTSDPKVFAQEAERLITKEGVCSVFGGWTSASRKTMKPVFEKHDHLLWYPVEYEGLEQSPNIIYTGAAPNQHILPAADYAAKNIGKKFYLVGSDYVYPRSANAILKERVAELKGEILGEKYEKLGGTHFKKIVEDIVQKKPSVIINTINGDSNVAFYRELRKAGVRPRDIPVISFSIGEGEIHRMGVDTMVGDYTSCNYFQSISTKENKAFVKKFQDRYGKHRVTSDPVEAAYNGVYLFAKAVEKAKSENASAIRDAAKGLSLKAPEGEIRIDPDSQHLQRTARIGQICDDGQFKIVWSSDTPIKPDPYPHYKSQKEWKKFLQDLSKKWGGKWER